MADQGEPEGFALLAYQQTKGRGSRGRVWVAPPGNLNLSVLFRPAGLVSPVFWGLRAAISLYDAFRHFSPTAELTLKWPNDVLLAGRKLAGLIVDTAQDGQGGCRWLILGMGANLRYVPPDLERPLACFADTGMIVAPEALATQLLDSLYYWREADSGTVRSAWVDRAHPIGTTLHLTGTEISGEFVGLDSDGAVLITVAGETRRFFSGDFVPA